MMALPTERQKTAERLARELDAMDLVWVTSPLPVAADAKLRFQLADTARNEVLQLLKDSGWDPVFVSILPRVCPTGLMGACLYEIDLPRERQPVPDDRTIYGEVVDRQKEAAQKAAVKAMTEAIYGKQRR